MARSIYEMRLHEIVNTEFYSILRVAGGWIYSCIVYKTSVFVPWHNEFQQANEPCAAEGTKPACNAAYPGTGPVVIGGTVGAA